MGEVRWEMSEAVSVLRRDPELRAIVKRMGPVDLRARRPYFWLLASAIIAQQVSGPAAPNPHCYRTHPATSPGRYEMRSA